MTAKAPGGIQAYGQRASRYDRNVKWFDIFAWFGFDISGWRRQAVGSLGLRPGDTVVDVGCGTGLNFPLLQEAITSEGKIIGVDISQAMLDQARQTVSVNGWGNVELICADAAQFEFPPRVDGILSAYTLILVPDGGRVIANACEALRPDGCLSILDMAWPRYCPLWWRHVLFFLRSYGVTKGILRARPWRGVQDAMAERLVDYSSRQRWFGFFYLADGRKPSETAAQRGDRTTDESGAS